MKTLQEYLKENTIEALENKKQYPCPFKKYRPLDAGNVKLYKGILSFSLIPGNTCKRICNGCYDLKSLRYPSVRDKRAYNTWLVIHRPAELADMMIEQILNSRTCNAVRIHVGGDFALGDFTLAYIAMWRYVVERVHAIKPNIKFYTYTKTEHASYLRDSGVNVVESIREDGRYNFGPVDELKEYAAKNPHWKICPALLDKNVTCGESCKLCQDLQFILFPIH